MILTAPQLLISTGIGAMKSLTSAGNDDEARLLTKALPKALQVPGAKTPAAVRLMAASPKVNAGRVFPAIGSVTAPGLLTAPSESVAVSVTRLPQQGTEFDAKQVPTEAVSVTHVSSPRFGTEPPVSKSKVTRRSPAVRFSVMEPTELLVKPAVAFWLISKSMLAVPRTLVRSQAR